MSGVDVRGTTLDFLTSVFTVYPELVEVRLFGSRVTGASTNRSDI